MELNTLFEDHHLIAANKPAGLATQAPAGIDSLEARVKEFIKVKHAKPAGVYLGVPHRLDRPVTGVVLFCRNTKAAQRVAALFEARAVEKVYWAVVAGVPSEPTGLWLDYLRKVPDLAKAEIVALPSEGKQANTAYRVLGTFDGKSLLELRPKTGRMHQLRIQAAARGLPILGDELYGSTTRFVEAEPKRIALHAVSLTLEHPFRKEPLTITAPTDPAWSGFLPGLG